MWDKIKKWFRRRPMRVVTAFPAGTIVKYNGIPCELLEDTPYYSATYRPTTEASGDHE